MEQVMNSGQVANELDNILMQYISADIPIQTEDGKHIVGISIKDGIIIIHTNDMS